MVAVEVFCQSEIQLAVAVPAVQDVVAVHVFARIQNTVAVGVFVDVLTRIQDPVAIHVFAVDQLSHVNRIRARCGPDGKDCTDHRHLKTAVPVDVLATIQPAIAITILRKRQVQHAVAVPAVEEPVAIEVFTRIESAVAVGVFVDVLTGVQDAVVVEVFADRQFQRAVAVQVFRIQKSVAIQVFSRVQESVGVGVFRIEHPIAVEIFAHQQVEDGVTVQVFAAVQAAVPVEVLTQRMEVDRATVCRDVDPHTEVQGQVCVLIFTGIENAVQVAVFTRVAAEGVADDVARDSAVQTSIQDKRRTIAHIELAVSGHRVTRTEGEVLADRQIEFVVAVSAIQEAVAVQVFTRIKSAVVVRVFIDVFARIQDSVAIDILGDGKLQPAVVVDVLAKVQDSVAVHVLGQCQIQDAVSVANVEESVAVHILAGVKDPIPVRVLVVILARIEGPVVVDVFGGGHVQGPIPIQVFAGIKKPVAVEVLGQVGIKQPVAVAVFAERLVANDLHVDLCLICCRDVESDPVVAGGNVSTRAGQRQRPDLQIELFGAGVRQL